MAAEIIAHRREWNFMAWARELAHSALLVIGASKSDAEANRTLADAVTRAGGKVSALTLPSDHAFQDHRIALASEVVDWLEGLP